MIATYRTTLSEKMGYLHENIKKYCTTAPKTLGRHSTNFSIDNDTFSLDNVMQNKRHKITDYHKQQYHNLNIGRPVNIKSGDPGFNSIGKMVMV
jgi:hypothetical protein